jgi:hypothetical protein
MYMLSMRYTILELTDHAQKIEAHAESALKLMSRMLVSVRQKSFVHAQRVLVFFAHAQSALKLTCTC